MDPNINKKQHDNCGQFWGPKMDPKIAQDGKPALGQTLPELFRSFQGGPQMAQDGGRIAQDRPKIAQDGPRFKYIFYGTFFNKKYNGFSVK